MDSDQIFKIRYDGMTEALKTQKPKDMLDIALALRQILIDGTCLVHIVNRERKLKLRFTVGMSVEERAEEMAALGIPASTFNLHFLTEFPPNDPRNSIKIDELLSFKVVKHEGNYYSVKELIKACCNRLGAVHYGTPEGDNETEAGIRRLGEFLEVQGVNGAFGTLALIGNIAVDGLSELRQKIE